MAPLCFQQQPLCGSVVGMFSVAWTDNSSGGEALNFQRNSRGERGVKALYQVHKMMPALTTSKDEPLSGKTQPGGGLLKGVDNIYQVFYSVWPN